MRMTVKYDSTDTNTRSIGVDLSIPTTGKLELTDLAAYLCENGLTFPTKKVVLSAPKDESSHRSFVGSSEHIQLDKFATDVNEIPSTERSSTNWTPADFIEQFTEVKAHISCVRADGSFYFHLDEGI